MSEKKRKLDTSAPDIAILQLPDTLTKKSAVLNPPPRFFLSASFDPKSFFAKCVLASETHLDTTRNALREGYKDSEFEHLQTKIKGGEIRIFSQLDRTVEFSHLQISITGYQWFDSSSASWKRVKGNRFSTRYLIFLFYEGQQYHAHLVHPIAVYSHPSQRESLRSILGYGLPVGVTPVIEDIIPNYGPAYCQNTTCITGSGFDAPCVVTFGEQTAIIEYQKPTWIKCRTPLGNPGTVTVSVMAEGRVSNDDMTYTFLNPPGKGQVEIPVNSKQIITNPVMPLKENPHEGNFYPMDIERYETYFRQGQNYVYNSNGGYNTRKNREKWIKPSALHYAASFGKAGLIKSLIQENQQPCDLLDSISATPLYWTVWSGHEIAVNTLLDLGASPNSANKYKETPLHIACLFGNHKLVELLIQKNAEIDPCTKSGETPLFFAAGMGSVPILKTLIQHGANILAFNSESESAEHWAELGEHFEARTYLQKETISYILKIAFEEQRFQRTANNKQKGYLMLLKNNYRNPHRFFFVLDTFSLHYYKKVNKKEKKGEIFLNDIDNIYLVPNNDNKKFKFFIQINNHKNPWLFICSDKTQRDNWIESIRENMIKLQKQGFQSIKSLNYLSITHKKQDWITLDDLEQISMIKKEYMGQVFIVKKRDTRCLYTMKVINQSLLSQQDKPNQASLQRIITSGHINYPFLAKLHYHFQHNNNLYLITDFCQNGSLTFLLSQVHRLKTEVVRFFSAQVLLGLDYLHKMGIIYRNLVPDNVMITNQGNILLTNFEFCKEFNDKDTPNCLTFDAKLLPDYLAPELIIAHEYTKAIDYWSLGVLIYNMITGSLPFSNSNECNKKEIYTNIMSKKISFPDWMPPDSVKILSGLLVRDSSKRVTDPEALKEHIFFRDIDWQKLESNDIKSPHTPIPVWKTDISFLQNIDDEFAGFTFVAQKNDSSRDPTPSSPHLANSNSPTIASPIPSSLPPPVAIPSPRFTNPLTRPDIHIYPTFHSSEESSSEESEREEEEDITPLKTREFKEPKIIQKNPNPNTNFTKPRLDRQYSAPEISLKGSLISGHQLAQNPHNPLVVTEGKSTGATKHERVIRPPGPFLSTSKKSGKKSFISHSFNVVNVTPKKQVTPKWNSVVLNISNNKDYRPPIMVSQRKEVNILPTNEFPVFINRESVIRSKSSPRVVIFRRRSNGNGHSHVIPENEEKVYLKRSPSTNGSKGFTSGNLEKIKKFLLS